MPSWYSALFAGLAIPPFHNEQANNPHFGKRKSRNNWEQKKTEFKARVEKRRAKKKANKRK